MLLPRTSRLACFPFAALFLHLFAFGFTGQMLEHFYPLTVEEVVGVRIPSYASVSFTYRFGVKGVQ
jgi:hypothetical protein